jgi:hypothetical protein
MHRSHSENTGDIRELVQNEISGTFGVDRFLASSLTHASRLTWNCNGGMTRPGTEVNWAGRWTL